MNNYNNDDDDDDERVRVLLISNTWIYLSSVYRYAFIAKRLLMELSKTRRSLGKGKYLLFILAQYRLSFDSLLYGMSYNVIVIFNLYFERMWNAYEIICCLMHFRFNIAMSPYVSIIRVWYIYSFRKNVVFGTFQRRRRRSRRIMHNTHKIAINRYLFCFVMLHRDTYCKQNTNKTFFFFKLLI